MVTRQKCYYGRIISIFKYDFDILSSQFVTMQCQKILTFQHDIINLFGNAMTGELYYSSFTVQSFCFKNYWKSYSLWTQLHSLTSLPSSSFQSSPNRSLEDSLDDCLSSALLATFRMCFSVIVWHFLIWHYWALLRSRRILISMNQQVHNALHITLMMKLRTVWKLLYSLYTGRGVQSCCGILLFSLVQEY